MTKKVVLKSKKELGDQKKKETKTKTIQKLKAEISEIHRITIVVITHGGKISFKDLKTKAKVFNFKA